MNCLRCLDPVFRKIQTIRGGHRDNQLSRCLVSSGETTPIR